jgi:IS30 family transposase
MREPRKVHRELSEGKRGEIMGLRRAGWSMRRIAKTMRVSLNAVHYTIQRKRLTGRHSDRPDRDVRRLSQPKSSAKSLALCAPVIGAH